MNREERIRHALTEVEQLCKEKKLRFTDIRRRVLELVWEHAKPSKAYDILEALKGSSFSAKPPTVYRALDFLSEHHFIHKLYRQNAYIGCTHPDKQHLCQILLCRLCGNVAEQCDRQMNEALHTLVHKHHFTPEDDAIEIAGVCADCSG